jgi:hypothetical protein
VGIEYGVQVIDPRPAFAHAARGAELFCDMVHLRDEGNRLLARAIAEHLDLSGLAASANAVVSEVGTK